MMDITGKTRVCGVIGDPIEHTLSPIMHNAAFDALKLDYAFLAFRVKSAEVENCMNGMRAFNTILNRDGKLFGFNTDGVGALRALRENGVELKGRKILLLGAGGAARAIAYTMAKEGDELAVLNRTLKPAQDLSKLLEKTANKKIISGALSPKEIQQNLQDSDILINATSVGMKPKAEESLIPPKLLRSNLAVMDIVYNPIETKLAREAKEAGAKVISGVEMLIYQGASSFEIWTGKSAPVGVMRQAALNHLMKV
jgi:shikimate dehydrogenase